LIRAALIAVLAMRLSAAPVFFKVRGATVMDVPMERYVAGVLAGESSVFRSDEALKAMAVAARTYAVRQRGRHAAEGYDFCTTTHCQRLDLDAITPRLESIAGETAGELLWFRGKPAFTPYTRDCGGRTEDAGDVWPDQAMPYLKSHGDPYCTRGATAAWTWAVDPRQIADALLHSQLHAPARLEQVSIARRTASGRALVLTLSGGGEAEPISASSFRFAIGRSLGWNTILSELYEVQTAGGRVVFQGRGAGHGVGLCQLGADQMGAEGRSYREILAFYYPGTAVGITARGLAWQRLGGDKVALFTTQPERDGAVLALAERAAREWVERTRWPVPPHVEIRVYPDLDSFRNATGEPGWVAGYTQGRRVHLQPAEMLRSRGVLEGTVRHEMLHVLVESCAAPDLPLWFREGLVGCLADGRRHGEAASTVANLIQRYGEATVLDWVSRGLPPEVKNSSASHAATKSK
jgi:stage II sporulation protein D